ncbi:MAG: hypothetical protein A2017_20665 [Lentisphaerae bacterium GWF2_44_16]|nr:MAG: hypothetical protein A2017_20665 [Lentisphaerae bacterium GWF2_44_16]
MAEKKKEKVKIIINFGCPDWMLSLGDCMSLLLCFFVLLLTFSTPSKDKLMDALGGIRGALSIMEPGTAKPGSPSETNENTDAKGTISGGGSEEIMVKKENLAVVNLRLLKVANKYNEFKDRLLELGFEKTITTKQLREGIMVEIPFDKLFVPRTVDFDPKAKLFLEGFANLASSVGNEVLLSACFNQDNANGANARYSTEWTLAQKRLLTIADFLSQKYNIAKNRFGYGYNIFPDEKPPLLKMLLVEKTGTREVNITELINMNNDI